MKYKEVKPGCYRTKEYNIRSKMCRKCRYNVGCKRTKRKVYKD